MQVLIVEDERNLADALRQILEEENFRQPLHMMARRVCLMP